ncbi:small membrane A-kinase anchor protein isoform X1 [Pan troglodytes]|uniref:small membrane A-kinase anchor protein isoform X1 n=1 Tax=Pan troglodytes TaxID=9598 RepID=UPI0030139F5E
MLKLGAATGKRAGSQNGGNGRCGLGGLPGIKGEARRSEGKGKLHPKLPICLFRLGCQSPWPGRRTFKFFKDNNKNILETHLKQICLLDLPADGDQVK